MGFMSNPSFMYTIWVQAMFAWAMPASATPSKQVIQKTEDS